MAQSKPTALEISNGPVHQKIKERLEAERDRRVAKMMKDHQQTSDAKLIEQAVLKQLYHSEGKVQLIEGVAVDSSIDISHVETVNVRKPSTGVQLHPDLRTVYRMRSHACPRTQQAIDSLINTIREKRERAIEDFTIYAANDTIHSFIEEGEMEALRGEVAEAFQGVLDALVIDTKRDHNTKETAKRVAKMYLQEVFYGRYQAPPPVTDFPNSKNLDEIYTLGPISIRSACSHHFVPIIGRAWIGIMPSERVIGISKFNRMTDWICSRPHIQEESAIMMADLIEEMVQPRGVAIIIKAQHYCMKWRGVKDNTIMTNSICRGSFREDKTQFQEFRDVINGMGFHDPL